MGLIFNKIARKWVMPVMERFSTRIKRFVSDNRSALNMIFTNSIILSIISAVFYFLIPIILNYPEGTVGGTFQRELENADYTQQFILITVVILFINAMVILYKMRGVENWRNLLGRDDPQSIHELTVIRQKCMILPYSIYIIQLIVPNALIMVMHAFTIGSFSITTLKISMVFFSFITLAAVINHIFSRKILTKTLLKISSPTDAPGKRIDLKKKIFIQMIPMFIVALLFTSLIGYSRLVREKGDLLFKIYSSELDRVLEVAGEIDSPSRLKDIINQIQLQSREDGRFVVSPQQEYQSLNIENLKFSPFFKKYLREMSRDNHGRVYDYYGYDIQGAVRWVNINGEQWIAGIKYVIASNNTVSFFIVSFAALLSLCCFVLYYFSKSLAGEITLVAERLKEIADGGDIDFEKKLVVTSNDEIGDLVSAFNSIQDKEKENIKAIQEKQEMLMEQERLASLGQLIGGIAHNLKTPIMSISGAVEALKDLVTEYDESIEDERVTNSDHHEIAREMKDWLKKVRRHCSYMSDIISTVKGQAVRLSNSSTNSFTIGELVKRVDILMKYELKRYNCQLNLESHVDMNTEIKGELNNLVQIFDNIIVNAIQSYGEKSGIIDFKIVKKGKDIIFSFRDYGCGIPPEIQGRLFKEMLTTKGKNGTGLGLYMSYSTIKGRFGGNMWFESQPGKGSTFYISIPCGY